MFTCSIYKETADNHNKIVKQVVNGTSMTIIKATTLMMMVTKK